MKYFGKICLMHPELKGHRRHAPGGPGSNCVGCDRTRKRAPEYRAKQRTRSRPRDRARYATDPIFRLAKEIRNVLNNGLRDKGLKRDRRSHEYFGCSSRFLKKYLKVQLPPWWDWMDHGKPDGWHIDHERPKASFNLNNPEQVRQCWHYSNLQPLGTQANIKKSSMWDGSMWRGGVRS